jgi:uncharacterized protein YbaR (Trm112 family)
MVDEPPHPRSFDPYFESRTLAQLACPACYGELRLALHEGDSRFLCVACDRAYPVVNGIPVLIVERAARFGERQ